LKIEDVAANTDPYDRSTSNDNPSSLGSTTTSGRLLDLKIPILFLAFTASIWVLVACDGGDQAASPAATDTEPTAQVETIPSSTKGGPPPEQPGPGAATVAASAEKLLKPTQPDRPDGKALLLQIAAISADLPNYDRKTWKHWIDEDSDCQNTRHEVLIEESSKEVTFKRNKRCQVATGEWLAPFTDSLVTDAIELDVDHMVPLKNAHDSGGWAWDRKKKAAYANEMGYANHLIAVTASANRQKGAAGPEEWRPTDQGYWCEYAIDWVQIKSRWGLSATQAEWTSLQEMLRRCSDPPLIAVVQPEDVPPPTATPASGRLDPADIQISAMDCTGKPEIVTIKNEGTGSHDLTGWSIEDDGAKHTFNFPAGFSLTPGSSLLLISGEPGNDSNEALFWNNRTIWNNDGDTASLFDRKGQLISQRHCP
jgi:hypothetical protein